MDRWSGRRAAFVAAGGFLAATRMGLVPLTHRVEGFGRGIRTERGRRYGQGAVTVVYTAGLSAGQVAGPVGFGAVIPAFHIGGAFEVGAAVGVFGTAAAWWLLRSGTHLTEGKRA